MSNWLKKLDTKLGSTVEQVDQMAHPVTNVLNFEVFRADDEQTTKAAALLRIRQDAAGVDYAVTGCAETPCAPEQADAWCPSPALCVEHSRA